MDVIIACLKDDLYNKLTEVLSELSRKPHEFLSENLLVYINDTRDVCESAEKILSVL